MRCRHNARRSVAIATGLAALAAGTSRTKYADEADLAGTCQLDTLRFSPFPCPVTFGDGPAVLFVR